MACCCGDGRETQAPVGFIGDLAEGIGDLAGAVRDVTGTARQIYDDVSDGLRAIGGTRDANQARRQAQTLQRRVDELEARLAAAERQALFLVNRVRNASGRAGFYEEQFSLALAALEPLGIVRRIDRVRRNGDGEKQVVGHDFRWRETADPENARSGPAGWILDRIAQAGAALNADPDEGDSGGLLGMLGAAAVGFVGGRASKRGGQ